MSSAGPRRRHLGGQRWEGVAVEAYKAAGEPFRGVTRQVLFGADAGGRSELRYFEVETGGWTALERHAHVHQVLVLVGSGRALVGERLVDLSAIDALSVPARAWQQVHAATGAATGFTSIGVLESD